MAKRDGWQMALSRVLKDGQWHRVADLYGAVAKKIPPETAYRYACRDYALQAKRRQVPYVPPVDVLAAITVGRWVVVVRGLTEYALERRGGFRAPDREVRLLMRPCAVCQKPFGGRRDGDVCSRRCAVVRANAKVGRVVLPRKCQGCDVVFTPPGNKTRFHSRSCGLKARRRREGANHVGEGGERVVAGGGAQREGPAGGLPLPQVRRRRAPSDRDDSARVARSV